MAQDLIVLGSIDYFTIFMMTFIVTLFYNIIQEAEVQLVRILEEDSEEEE